MLGNRQLLPLRYAIAAEDGEIDFFVTERAYSHSTLPRKDCKTIKVEKVPALAFRQVIIEARKIAGPHGQILVKMDIEGTERDVILNTEVRFLSQIEEIFIETHRFASYTPIEIEEHLKRAGFFPSWPSKDIIHGKRIPRYN